MSNDTKKLFAHQAIKPTLRRNRLLPHTLEDRAQFERMLETAFCAMAQNKEVYGGYSHETILEEARHIATVTVNVTREVFSEHGLESEESAFGESAPSTGVFSVLAPTGKAVA